MKFGKYYLLSSVIDKEFFGLIISKNVDTAKNNKKSSLIESFFLFYEEYLISMHSKFKGIFLLIEQNCEKQDYEDIQHTKRLKMHHLGNH